jgi:RNA-binding protein YhbY
VEFADVKKYVQHQKASIIIGKNRLNSGILKEIETHIKRKGMIKIKILKAALTPDYSKSDLINDLVSQTNLCLIDVRGYSVIVSNSPRK